MLQHLQRIPDSIGWIASGFGTALSIVPKILGVTPHDVAMYATALAMVMAGVLSGVKVWQRLKSPPKPGKPKQRQKRSV